MQDTASQRVSHAAAALQEKVISLFPDIPLRVLELGSGCGIISIMLALQRPSWQISGIEIQSRLVQLARQNAASSGTMIDFIHHDLRAFSSSGYDLIVANPPFRRSGTGRPNPDPSLQISRDDALCTPSDVTACVRRNLARTGSALLIYPSQRQADLEDACGKSLLDIIATCPSSGTNKYLIFLIKHKGQNP